MMNFENAQICAGEEQRIETVKELLENMGTILDEIGNQVGMISDALYRGGNHGEKEPANEPCAMPPMVVVMRDQRDAAECLLKEIVKIRDALW